MNKEDIFMMRKIIEELSNLDSKEFYTQDLNNNPITIRFNNVELVKNKENLPNTLSFINASILSNTELNNGDSFNFIVYYKNKETTPYIFEVEFNLAKSECNDLYFEVKL